MDISTLAIRRNEAQLALDAATAELRVAAVAAVSGGRPLASVAREAGVTRPTLYAWCRDSGAERERLVSRLAELDARWEKLVSAAMQHDMPAGVVSRRGNQRSGLQVEAQGRKVSRGDESAAALVRRGAETKLLSLVADMADKDATFAAVRDELDEAWKIRQSLAALDDASCGF